MDIKGYNVNFEDLTIEITFDLEDYLFMLYRMGAISSDELGDLIYEYL